MITSPVIYYPGSTPIPASVPIAPPALPDVCWDEVQLIRAGYSTPQQWYALTGVWREIRSIVWHDMEGYLAGAIARWNTGAAGAHLCVLRNGRIVLTCDLRNVAWHAGTSAQVDSDTYGRTEFWRRTNVNPFSIGVELEGFVASEYTPEQLGACRRITDWVTAKHNVLRARTWDVIDGHHAHSEISARRGDPGPLFDWSFL